MAPDSGLHLSDRDFMQEDDMGLLSRLFGRGDDRIRNDPQRDAARKLSPAMPMAGAGAELDGQRRQSETEEALERAAGGRPNGPPDEL
jgi:hypothetical protein